MDVREKEHPHELPRFLRSALFQYNRPVKVSDLSEFGLIERLERLIARRQPAPQRSFAPITGPGHQLLLGIGDDCAVWQTGDLVQLATTDTLVQDVHFTPNTISWKDLGWKALAINLSDIAAMGGIPSYALITLGLPDRAPVDGVLELYDGMLDCACAYNTLLVGGDIVGAPLYFISLTVLGEPSGRMSYPNNVLLRSGAKPGDAIAITGHVGSSAAGLKLLRTGGLDGINPSLAFALEAHRRPAPRLETGQLALEAGVRCGMDVSDGLVGDLAKICAVSGVAAAVELQRVPVREELRKAFPEEWAGLALTGGEDYELLLTGPAEVLDAVGERSDLPISVIGRILAGTPGEITVRDRAGKIVDMGPGGWDHLARR